MDSSQAGPLNPPSPIRVKVCGVREPDEAAALDALGVDWIGFNFYPKSPRYVAPEAAAPQIRALRRSVPVGVFVDASIEDVIRVATLTGIRLVQLHGSEDWDAVRRMPLPVIKAIPHTRLHDWGGMMPDAPVSMVARGAVSAADATPLRYFLVDTASGSSFGGTGRVFDWDLLRRHPLPLPYFLAGGLGPHNLAEALARTSPYAVDLNSKVEIAPGRKDLAKVKACLDLVRAARA